ncbi:MAG: hypothetical protein AAFO99_07490 [Bacteroidota bacterium]
MKTKFFALVSLFTLYSTFLWGQSTTFEGQIIPVDRVPEEVVTTHETNFGGKKTLRWKYQKSKGRKGNSFTRYVAVMKEGKRPLSNARYSPDGTLIYYAEYYGTKTIPSLLRSDLDANFSDYRVTGGTHIKLYKTQKEYYRVRLKKEALITYVFYDKNGTQVDRAKLPQDADFK